MNSVQRYLLKNEDVIDTLLDDNKEILRVFLNINGDEQLKEGINALLHILDSTVIPMEPTGAKHGDVVHDSQGNEWGFEYGFWELIRVYTPEDGIIYAPDGTIWRRFEGRWAPIPDDDSEEKRTCPLLRRTGVTAICASNRRTTLLLMSAILIIGVVKNMPCALRGETKTNHQSHDYNAVISQIQDLPCNKYREAYRRAMVFFHSDKITGSHDISVLINAAYDIKRDMCRKEKRAQKHKKRRQQRKEKHAQKHRAGKNRRRRRRRRDIDESQLRF